MTCWRALPATGLTPSRTLEKMTIGKVVEDGPETKLVMTRSSSESVKESSQPVPSSWWSGVCVSMVTTRLSAAAPTSLSGRTVAVAEVRAVTDELLPRERIQLPGVYIDRVVTA